jgi:hypothetical protein
MLTEEELEALYAKWANSDAHLYEGEHYGHERAAFYAGVAAGHAMTTILLSKRQAED